MSLCASRAAGAVRDERGQAMVEFALVMPILLILVIGIIEFGRAWNMSQVLTQAAREGARAAAVHDEAGQVTEQSIKNVIDNILNAAGFDLDSCDEPDLANWAGPTDTPVVVSLACEYQFVFFGPIIGWATDKSTITLRSSFAMRNE